MRTEFPLFHSHLDLAHRYWSGLVQPGDVVVDATCGNGYDSLVLAQLALTEHSGQLHLIDIQAEALDATRARLNALPAIRLQRVLFHLQSHENFPAAITPHSVRLVVFNLGYLPGGDKGITTRVSTTLKSIQNALSLLQMGGCLCITAYPGHAEGAREETALMPLANSLPTQEWNVCHHRWLNRQDAPSLLLIQRRSTSGCPSQPTTRL